MGALRGLQVLSDLERECGQSRETRHSRPMAAVGFAGLLVVILKSGEVQGILTDLVRRALTIAG